MGSLILNPNLVGFTTSNSSEIETMKKIVKFILLSGLLGFAFSNPLPQEAKEEDQKPMPYSFGWEVNEREAKTDGAFFTHNEQKKEEQPDRTEGKYTVWLPDGRLMIVNYYVDKDSGFVPTITYEDGYAPEWKN